MTETYLIWLGQRVIASVSESSLKPGQFFWYLADGAANYAPTLDDAAKAAKKRYQQDATEHSERLKSYALDTYNTRKNAKKVEKKTGQKFILV